MGVKKETADMYFSNAGIPVFNNREYTLYAKSYTDVVEKLNNQISSFDFIPAWSLHRLVQMIPSAVYQADSIRYFMIEQGHNVGYWYFGEDECELCKIWSRKDLYNNIIDCIKWLIKKGYFNKEYLEE